MVKSHPRSALFVVFAFAVACANGANDVADGGSGSGGGPEDAGASDASTLRDALASNDAWPSYDGAPQNPNDTGDASSAFTDTGTPGCASGLTSCGQSCVDLKSNALHCGRCGRSCLGQPCSDAACAPVVVSSDFTATGRIALDAANVYWTNGDGAVRRAPIAGGPSVTLATAQSGPTGIAVDATNAYVANKGSGTIVKIPLAGGAPVTLASSQPNPHALAIDGANVYWTNLSSGAGNGTIMRCAIAGCGGAPTTLATGLQYAYGLAVDATYAYWTTLNAGGQVHRAPVAGGLDAVFASSLVYPFSIALDATSVVMLAYGQAGQVFVAPSQGGTPKLLAGNQSFPKEVTTDGVAAYWTFDNPASDGATVMKCELAGCNYQPLVLARGTQPCEAIVTDNTWAYWLSNDGKVLKTPK